MWPLIGVLQRPHLPWVNAPNSGLPYSLSLPTNREITHYLPPLLLLIVLTFSAIWGHRLLIRTWVWSYNYVCVLCLFVILSKLEKKTYYASHVDHFPNLTWRSWSCFLLLRLPYQEMYTTYTRETSIETEYAYLISAWKYYSQLMGNVALLWVLPRLKYWTINHSIYIYLVKKTCIFIYKEDMLKLRLNRI